MKEDLTDDERRILAKQSGLGSKHQIENIYGDIIGEWEKDHTGNSFKEAIKEYVRVEREKEENSKVQHKYQRYIDLRGRILWHANLSGLDLRHTDLRGDMEYATLRDANLSYANLSHSNLRNANLSGANLSYADLSYADLRGADLSSVNLICTNLNSAKTDKKYISISGVGLKKWEGHLDDKSFGIINYCVEDDKIWCSQFYDNFYLNDFKGTLAEFTAAVEKEHGGNEVAREYYGLINYLNYISGSGSLTQAIWKKLSGR